jgi:hypothetical protein
MAAAPSRPPRIGEGGGHRGLYDVVAADCVDVDEAGSIDCLRQASPNCGVIGKVNRVEKAYPTVGNLIG